MAISDRITSIEEHIKESYQELEGIGIDTTGVNKNLENIPKLIDGYWETLPKVTGEGTSITLDNTKEGKMKIVLKGNTYQDSTTGKNLYNDNFDDYTQPVNYRICPIDLEIGQTYTLKATLKGTSMSGVVAAIVPYGNQYVDFSTVLKMAVDSQGYVHTITFTPDSTWTSPKLAIYASDKTTFNNLFTNYEIQLEKGSTATDYEKFTYGASPNPDYPQDVHIVSGDNTIKSCAKNLYNVNDGESVAQEVVIDNDSWISVSYDNTSGSTNRIFNCRMKPSKFLKPNTTYKIVVEVKSISGNGVLTINEGANQQSQIYDGFIKDFSALSSNSIVMKNAKTWASLEGKSRLSTQYIYFRPGQSGSITFRVSLIEDTTLIPSTFIYEPYQSQSYAVNLGTLELCKIGTYQDRFIRNSGKNLFDASTFSAFTSNVQYVLINLKPNTEYIMTTNLPEWTGVGANLFIMKTSEDASSSTNGVRPNQSRTLTTDSTGVVKIGYRDGDNSLSDEKTKYWYMLNEGSTALEYEPYGSGEWYVKKEIKKHIISNTDIASISSYWYSTYGQYGATIDKTKLGISGVSDRASLCNIAIKINALRNIVEHTYIFNANAGALYFFSSTYDTVAHANEELVGAEIIYNLDIPEYTKITGELESQLNALAKSYEGQTNISQESNDLASILNATALEEM